MTRNGPYYKFVFIMINVSLRTAVTLNVEDFGEVEGEAEGARQSGRHTRAPRPAHRFPRHHHRNDIPFESSRVCDSNSTTLDSCSESLIDARLVGILFLLPLRLNCRYLGAIVETEFA